VQLGTRTGDDDLFPEHELSSREKRRIQTVFGRDGFELRYTSFEPDFLPLVLVHDWEVELKHRLEDEEADKRISTAALGLARLFTEKISDEIEGRIYVNMASPLVRAMLESDNDGQVGRAADLLWAMATMMAPKGARDADFEATLRSFSSTIADLVGLPKE
jgi:molecular chaperone HtpG